MCQMHQSWCTQVPCSGPRFTLYNVHQLPPPRITDNTCYIITDDITTYRWQDSKGLKFYHNNCSSYPLVVFGMLQGGRHDETAACNTWRHCNVNIPTPHGLSECWTSVKLTQQSNLKYSISCTGNVKISRLLLIRPIPLELLQALLDPKWLSN